MHSTPQKSISELIHISIAFLGIQMGFALQAGNASRLLQTFGADLEHLPLFWLADPLTGLIVQPLIGYYSDRTRSQWGRRKPYLLVGGLLSALSLFLFPHFALLTSILPPLLFGALLMVLMDSSFNTAMHPLRALIADQVPRRQQGTAFAIQTFLIGIGAIVGSALPYILSAYMGFDKTSSQGLAPPNVAWAFYIGGSCLLVFVLWTLIHNKKAAADNDIVPNAASKSLIHTFKVLNKEFKNMPREMLRIGFVQFFSWFAFFSMWVYMAPALTQHFYHSSASNFSSVAYADAGNLTGLLFGSYSLASVLFALGLPFLYKRLGQRISHFLALSVGALGFIFLYFAQNQTQLYVAMLPIGIAWASILASPYALLASILPKDKVGVYMGLFNLFITLPQIVNGLIAGLIVKHLFHNQAIYALLLSGLMLFIAAGLTLLLKTKGQRLNAGGLSND